MDNKLFELFDTFKIVVYVPFSVFPDYLKRLETKGINRTYEYKNCMSWTEVTSVRTSLEGVLGGVGKRSMEKEVRLEFICDKANLRDIVRFMKLVHPYESPEIDILPIIQLDD